MQVSEFNTGPYLADLLAGGEQSPALAFQARILRRIDDPGGQHLRRLRERLKESGSVRDGSITNDEALAAQQLNERMLGISQESVGV